MQTGCGKEGMASRRDLRRVWRTSQGAEELTSGEEGRARGGADAALSARGRRESSSIPSRRRAAHATKGYKNTQGQTNVSFLPLRPGRDCLNTGVASDFCVSLNTASVLTLSTDPTMLYSAA